MTSKTPLSASELRKKAEKKVGTEEISVDQLSSAEIRKAVHELKVHQAELEIQNEELRRAQLDLTKSRDRFSNFFESAPVGYLVLDENAMILEVNSTFSEMLEMDKSAILHKALNTFMHSDDQNVFITRYRAFYKQPEDKKIEVRFKNASGHYFFGSIEGRHRISDTGSEHTVTQMLLTISDINDFQLAKNMVAEKETLYSNLYNSAHDAILVADDNARYIDVNPAACVLLGYTEEELLELSVWDITPGMNREKGRELWQQFINKGSLEGEYVVQDKTGRKRTTSYRAVANVTPGRHYSVLRDITKEKEYLAEITTSQKFLDNVLSGIADGFFALDQNMHISYFNPAAEKLLGRKAKDVIGKHFTDEAFPEAKESYFDQKYSAALRSRKPDSFEAFFEEDPYRNWYEVRVHPLLNGIGIFFQVITERKKETERIRQEHDLLQNITETSPVGIAVVSKDGQITFANPEAEKVLRLEKTSITARSYNDPLWHITDYDGNPFPDAELPFSIVKKTGKPVYNVEHAIEYPDGKRTLLKINAAPQNDDQGNFSGMVAAMEDVTEKVTLEEQLNRERDRALDYLTIAGTLFIALDTDGKVTLANHKACEILGYSEKEILGQNWFDHFLPEENIEDVKKVFTKIISGKLTPVEFYENPVRTKSGEIRTVAWHNSILKDETGKIIGLLSSGEDITKHKKLEKELIQYSWLLEKEEQTRPQTYSPYYGDVTQLNTERTILDAVGQDVMQKLGADVMDLLDTSLAVYEKNGDYAFGMFASGWCQFMDASSRRLCGDVDNQEALSCGKWLCHENCWNNSAKAAIESGQNTDIHCVGGIHLYAVPIKAGGDVIGVINIGYGTPPTEAAKLKKLAKAFNVDADQLTEIAEAYHPRPQFIIDVAKRRLESIAQLIGERVERKWAEEALRKSEDFLRRTGEMARVGGWEINFDDNTVYWSETTKKIHEVAPDYVPTLEEAIDFFPGESKKIINTAVNEAITKGKAYDLVVRFKTAKGKLRWTRTIGIPEMENGKCVRLSGTFQDITEQHIAQQATEESEQRYRDIVELSPDGIVTISPTGKVLSINHAFEELTGYTRSQIVNRHFSRIPTLVKSNAKTYLRLFSDILAGKMNTVEFDWQNKDGNLRRGEARLRLMRRAKKIIGIQCILTDITERKKAEAKLQKSENRFRQFFENQPAYCYMVSPEGKILDVNRSALQQLGYKKEELIGKPLLTTIYAPASQARAKELFQRWKDGAMLQDEHIRIVTRRGGERSVLLSASVLRNENGEILHSLSIQRDITALEKISRELREIHSLYQQTIENASGIPYRLLYDKVHYDFFGTKSGDILGVPASDMTAAKMQELVQDVRIADPGGGHNPAAYGQKYRQGEVDRYLADIRIRKPSGEEIWLSDCALPIRNNEGHIIGSQGILMDITERKESERERLENQRAMINIMEDLRQEIEERKRSAAALRTSEEKFRLLITNLGEGFMISDLKETITFCNPAAEHIFGCRPGTLQGKKLTDFMSAETAKIIREETKNRKTGASSSYECEIRQPGGDQRQIYVNVNPWYENGTVTAAFAVVHDITEAKKSERILIRNEMKFRDIFQSTGEGIAYVNAKGIVVEANQALSDIIDIANEDLIGHHVFDLTKKLLRIKDTPRTLKFLTQILSGNIVKPFQVDYKGKILDVSAPRKSQSGFFTGVIRDVTERETFIRELTASQKKIFAANRKLEKTLEDLRHSEKRYRLIFEQMLDAFGVHEMIFDKEGNPQDYRFLSVNPAFEEMTGLKAGDLIGKTVLELLPGTEAYWIELYGEVVKTGEPRRFENFSAELDRYYEGVAYSPEAGQFVTIFQNITERVLARKALEQSEAIMAASQKIAKVGGWEYDLINETATWTEESYRIYELDRSEFGSDVQANIKRSLEFYPPEERATIQKAFQDLITEGKSYKLELPFESAKGQQKWVQLSGQAVYQDDKISKVIGTIQDITERKKMVENLRFQALLLDQIHDSVVATDLKGIVTYVNTAATRTLEKSVDELIGSATLEFGDDPGGGAKQQDILTEALEKGIWRGEVVNYTASGKAVIWDSRVQSITNEKGQKTGLVGISTNITERKQAQENLKEREKYYRTLFENTGTATIIIENDTTISLANSQFAGLCGIPREKLEGKVPFTRFIAEKDRAKMEKYHYERRKPDGPKVPRSYEFELQAEDGTIRQMIISVALIPGTRKSIASFLDITEMKQTERNLRESEAKFSDIFESAGEGIIYVDHSGKVLDINPAALEITGIPKEEIVAKSSFALAKRFIKTRDLPKLLKLVADVLAGQPVAAMEFRYEGKILEVSAPFSRRSKNITGLIRDVTEKRQTEEAIRLSEERFRNLFNQAAEMIFLHDMDGKIIDINDQTIQQYGYTRDELLKMTTMDIDPDYVQREEKGLFWKVFEKQTKVSFQGRHQRKDGSIFPVEVTLSQIRLGSEDYVLALARDVSEYTNLIAQLEESEQRLRALAAHLQNVREDERKAIAREIHDEIAQILTALKIDLTIFETDLAASEMPSITETLAPTIQEMKDLIDTTIRKIRSLIHRLRPETLENLGLIGSARNLLAEMSQSTNIKTEFHSDIQEPELAEDRALAVYRIIQEAGTNCLRYANASRFRVKLNQQKHSLVVIIEDNGRGFDPEKKEGTDGYGLIGMRERAILLDGELQIDSKPGKGTRIRLTIPLQEKK